jgi:hypothetical protein
METLLDLYSWFYLNFFGLFVTPPDGVFVARQYQKGYCSPEHLAAFKRYKYHPLVREVS